MRRSCTNQDTGRARKAASLGPVVLTDRGVPAHVLLSIEDYRRLAGTPVSMIEQLGMPPGIEDLDLDLPAQQETVRPVDFA